MRTKKLLPTPLQQTGPTNDPNFDESSFGVGSSGVTHVLTNFDIETVSPFSFFGLKIPSEMNIGL